MKRNTNWERLLTLISPIIVLVTWEMLVRLGYLEPLFFPPPSVIARTLGQLIVSGELKGELSATLRRIILGFGLGVIPGLVVGLMMGSSWKIRAFLDPLVSATYPVPKITLLPLVMLIFGIGELSKIILVAIGCFYLMLINSMAGVRNINPLYFEVAKNYGAGRLKTFFRVLLPGSLPVVFAGARLSLGISLLLVVMVEFASAQRGIGAMTWLAWQTLRTERLYAGIIIIALLGWTFTSLLQRLERILIPWGREVAGR